jgi:hypothetical protein
LLFQDAARDLYKQQCGSPFKSFEAWQYLWYQPQVPQKLKQDNDEGAYHATGLGGRGLNSSSIYGRSERPQGGSQKDIVELETREN